MFSQAVRNLHTPPAQEDAAFVQFIQELLIDPSTVQRSTFNTILELYPANDSSLGCPFNTGDSLFDRAEAWYTDNMYLAARRLLFQQAAPLQPLFAYFFREFIPGNDPTLGGELFGSDCTTIVAHVLTSFSWIRAFSHLRPGAQSC